MFNFINKLIDLFPRKTIVLLSILYILLIVIAILEMIGIGSIPVFLTLLFNPDPEKVIFGIRTTTFLDLFVDKKQLYIYFSIFLISFYFIKSFLIFLLNYFELNIMKNIKIEISKNLFSSYISKPYIFHVNQNSAVLSKNISHEIQYAAGFINSLIVLFKEITLLIVICLLLILFDPLLTLISFIVLLTLFSIFYFSTNNFLRRSANIRMISLTNLFKTLNLSFGSIKDIKIYKKENFFIDEFSRNQANHEKNIMNKDLVTRLPKIVFEFSGVALIMSLILFYVYTNKELIDLIPTLSLLAVSVIRLIPSFSSISNSTTFLRSWKNSFDLVYREISTNPFKKSNNTSNTKYDNDKSILKLDNINFTYPEKNKIQTIKDLSLEISKNEMVGIIGKSGAGKSTIVNIILNLLTPNNGNIRIHEIKNKNTTKNFFGYVPQDIYLIDDTIKKNIAFGESDKDINVDLIEDCIKKAGLEEFLQNTPKNLETVVGEKGIKISGGERQRLGIARALYKKPEILIMDEATSSLDNATEKKVLESIKKIKKDNTIIMIAHRLSTLENCDKVYLIEKGELIDYGKLDYLIKKYPRISENNV